MKNVKLIAFILLVAIALMGFFVGVVFLDNAIKDSFDNKDVKLYESKEDYLTNAPNYGYYLDISTKEEEFIEEDYSTNVFYKDNEIVRSETTIALKRSTSIGEISDITINVETNPTQSLLYKLTKNSFTNGAKARAESYNKVKTQISGMDVYGISFLDKEEDGYSYGFLVECSYANDCKVKIQLLMPIDIDTFNESSAYQRCVTKSAEILSLIK